MIKRIIVILVLAFFLASRRFLAGGRDLTANLAEAAAAALGRLRSLKAVAALLAHVDDPDATVRRAAIAALGESRDARAAPRLVTALADPALQASALEALRRLGTMALPEMERALASGETGPDLRKLLVDLAGPKDD